MNSLVLHVIVVVFVATLIRSSFGFGEALVAVPLLALRMPIQVAAPLAVLVSITIAAAVVVQDWRDIHVRSAGWLVLATLAGIPVGLWLLTRVDERLVKGILALTPMVFSVYALRGTRARWSCAERSGAEAGALASPRGEGASPTPTYAAATAEP